MKILKVEVFQNWTAKKWTLDSERTRQAAEFYSRFEKSFPDVQSVKKFVTQWGRPDEREKARVKETAEAVTMTIYSRSGMCGRIDEKIIISFAK